MSRVLKRPMFKMGGSTSGGITSGLKRSGYAEGERVTTEDILKEYGPAPRSSNVYDFLIDFGLNIASMPPQGNIISTAAGAAREPFSRFQEGKSKGDQLAYAMRAQAADKAMDVNLKREQMNVQKDIAAMSGGKDSFLKKDNRVGYVMDQAKLFADSGTGIERTHPQGMAEWEAIKLYDKVDVQLAPTVEDKGAYAVDESQFKPEDVNNIYWDPINRNYFTIKFNEAGVVEVDQTMEASYGDPENDYMDSNLQKLNNMLENKKSAEIIQSGDETDENDLTKIVATNKLDEGMVHPTSDGTSDGEILEEYFIQYAKDNKKILYDPGNATDKAEAIAKYKELGGSKAGYELVTKLFYKNFLKKQNKKGSRSANIKKVGLESQEKEAFKWYDRWWDRYQAGTITVPERFKKHLDAYQIQKAEKQEKATVKS